MALARDGPDLWLICLVGEILAEKFDPALERQEVKPGDLGLTHPWLSITWRVTFNIIKFNERVTINPQGAEHFQLLLHVVGRGQLAGSAPVRARNTKGSFQLLHKEEKSSATPETEQTLSTGTLRHWLGMPH